MLDMHKLEYACEALSRFGMGAGKTSFLLNLSAPEVFMRRVKLTSLL